MRATKFRLRSDFEIPDLKSRRLARAERRTSVGRDGGVVEELYTPVDPRLTEQIQIKSEINLRSGRQR